jgi:magnesium chelatase family protein
LSPADIFKEGNHFDLPIAIGLLVALKALPQDTVENSFFMGELGLDASLKPVLGALPAAIHASSTGIDSIYLPRKMQAKLLG